MGTLSEQLEKYFSDTPQDILDQDWKRIEPLNEIGPDVLTYAERVREYYANILPTQNSVIKQSCEPFTPEQQYYLAA